MGLDVGVALTEHGADRGALSELHAGSFVTTTGMRHLDRGRPPQSAAASLCPATCCEARF